MATEMQSSLASPAATWKSLWDFWKWALIQTVNTAQEHPWIAAGVGVGVLVTSHLLFKPKSKDDFKNKPSTAALTGGGIARAKVRDVYTDYHDAYGKDAGEGIKDRSRTTGKSLHQDALTWLATILL